MYDKREWCNDFGIQFPSSRAVLSEGISIFWPISAALAILYGSLIPFDLDFSGLSWSNGLGLGLFRLARTNLEDLITNVAIYVPLGCALVFALRSRGYFRGILLASMIGLMLSAAAEWLQTTTRTRVPSLIDIGLNTVGATLGAVATVFIVRCKTLWSRIRQYLRTAPFHCISVVMLLAILLYGIAPFDFVTSTTQMHDSFRRAANSTAPRETNINTLISMLGPLFWYVSLGYVAALAAREREYRPTPAVFSAALQGLVLAVVRELTQLFTRSHVFALTDIGVMAIAVTIGATLTILFAGQSETGPIRFNFRKVIPSSLLACSATAYCLVTFLAIGLGLARSGATLSSFSTITIPFESLWRGSMDRATCEVFAKVITFGAFSTILSILFRRASITWAWTKAGAIVFLIVLALAVFESVHPATSLDCTDIILAAISAMIFAHAYPTLRAMLESPTSSAQPDSSG